MGLANLVILPSVSYRNISESSVSFTRSPGRPSSFRSDEELGPTLDRLPSTAENGYLIFFICPNVHLHKGGYCVEHIVLAPFSRQKAFSNLPGVHRQAVEAIMAEVSALEFLTLYILKIAKNVPALQE